MSTCSFHSTYLYWDCQLIFLCKVLKSTCSKIHRASRQKWSSLLYFMNFHNWMSFLFLTLLKGNCPSSSITHSGFQNKVPFEVQVLWKPIPQSYDAGPIKETREVHYTRAQWVQLGFYANALVFIFKHFNC